MQLFRKGQHPHDQSVDAYYRLAESKKVRARFENFGRSWRKGKYDVELDWSDVRFIIHMFAQMDNPEASRLHGILAAADAAERLAWIREREERKNQKVA